MGKKGKRAAKASGGQPKEGTGAARRKKAAAIRKIEEGIDRLIERMEVELKDKDLFEPAIPKEECPICFLPSAYFEYKDTYMSCCGKIICSGCAYSESQLLKKNSSGKTIFRCAFCRKEFGTEQDDDDEFDQAKKRADLDDAEAMCHLATLYRRGIGVKQDELVSITHLLSASDKGNTDAMIGLAEACYKGTVIPPNEEKGARLASIVAKMGNPMAHEQLGSRAFLADAIDQANRHCFFAAKYGSKKNLLALDFLVKTGHLSQEDYDLAERLCMEANERVTSEKIELAKAYEEKWHQEARR